MHAFRLDSTRALITGASRGIGAAMAFAFAEAGAELALAARSESATDTTAERARLTAADGRTVVQLAGDLTQPGSAAHLVEEAARSLGGLDVLVHNAGVLPGDENPGAFHTFEKSSPEEWEEVLAVHLHAAVELSKAALPHLRRSPHPSVLLTASVAGLLGMPSLESYGVAKSAQISLVRSLSAAWAPYGIRVNCLCPGWIETDMTGGLHRDAEASETLMRHVPMRRWATPEEVAHPAVFLTSPAASYITGQALVIDGGLTAPHWGLTSLLGLTALGAPAY